MGKIWNDGYGGSIIGRVDSEGKIWNDGYGGHIVGRVDSEGKIWNDGYGGSIIGRVDSERKIWNDGYGGSIIGRIDSEGKIWNDGYGGHIVGRVDDGILAGGAALLLLDFSKNKDEKSGCLATIIGAIIGAIVAALIAIVKHSWAGRIGVAYGLALGILATVTQRGGVGLGIFFSIFFMLICGALGLLADFISSKLSRQGNIGALIGAAATGITMVVMAVIAKSSIPQALLLLLLALIPGLIAGAVIGAIVGLIKKLADKKKEVQS
jgi:type III secretory pathway component EscS